MEYVLPRNSFFPSFQHIFKTNVERFAQVPACHVIHAHMKEQQSVLLIGYDTLSATSWTLGLGGSTPLLTPCTRQMSTSVSLSRRLATTSTHHFFLLYAPDSLQTTLVGAYSCQKFISVCLCNTGGWGLNLCGSPASKVPHSLSDMVQ